MMMMIIIIITIQVVSRWDERIIACELDKRNEINNKKTKWLGGTFTLACRSLADFSWTTQHRNK